MDEVRWGIIGCGDVTEIKSGPGFQKAESSKLVAVMRRTGHLAGDYAKRHRVPRWYDRADSLINDPEVNAVYIATPPSSHKEYTLAAARAGKPVYVEKPMAMNYAECLEMISACEENKVPLYVAYYRRAQPRFLKIKSLIDEGAIGKIRTVLIRFYQPVKPGDSDWKKNWRVDPAVAGCGYFCDLGSHIIDLLQFYFGPITNAKGHVSNQAGIYPAEDTVSAIFRFENGIHGSGIWNFCADMETDFVEIIGDGGRIQFATFEEAPIILEKSGKREEFFIERPKHVHQPLIQTIVDELRGIGTCPSSGKTGAMTNKIMDQILGRV